MIILNDTISYLPASSGLLSADVIRLQGAGSVWFFDVGANDQALELILKTNGPKSIVISHFHPDHMGNLTRILDHTSDVQVYLSDNSYKYIRHYVQDSLQSKFSSAGEKGSLQPPLFHLVNEPLHITDGLEFHIFPLPSSHAKGSLGLEVTSISDKISDKIPDKIPDEEAYAFLGDGTCTTVKKGIEGYNLQLLLDQIRLLEKLEARTFCLSHTPGLKKDRHQVLSYLKNIYQKREGNQSFLPWHYRGI